MHRALPEVAPEAARPLLAALGSVPLEGVEYSFKLEPGMLLGDRLLAGVSLARVDPGWIVSSCRALALPESSLDELARQLPEADIVHFGYEARAEAVLFKVYLEYARRETSATAPVILHQAWKWLAAPRSPATLAAYRYIPGLDLEAIGSRIDALCGASTAPLLGDIAALAALRVPGALMYLEVEERDNPRASFDLNLHPAQLCLGDVEPQLRGLAGRLGAPRPAFDALYARARSARLGHLAAGRSRAGAEFATIYFARSDDLDG